MQWAISVCRGHQWAQVLADERCPDQFPLGIGVLGVGGVPQKDEDVEARGDFRRGQIYLFIYLYYTQEVDSFQTVKTSCHFCFFPPVCYDSDMTEMDELEPPSSACVRVTTRGQTPALILIYLKILETPGLKKTQRFPSHRKGTPKTLNPT